MKTRFERDDTSYSDMIIDMRSTNQVVARETPESNCKL